MIVGVLAILALIFGGGGHLQGAFFELPDVEKLIKRNVEDDLRKKQALKITKDYFKAVKEMRKEEKKLVKQLETAGADRNTSPEGLSDLVNSLSNNELKGMNNWVDLRMNITEVISREEFQKIIEAGTAENKKTEKDDQKVSAKQEKTFLKMRSTLKEEIANKETLDQILRDWQKYEDEVNGLLEMREKKNYKFDETLRNHNATREELQSAIDEFSSANQGVFKAYQTFHFQLIEKTSEAEWDNIHKKASKLIKG